MTSFRSILRSHTRYLAPGVTLGLALVFAAGIVFTPLGHLLAGGSMVYSGSSTWDNGIFSCGVVYTGSDIIFTDTNTCTFSCDAAHNGQTCSITSEVGTVASPIGCDNSTGCGGGMMYSHICQTSTYTCVYTAPVCPADNSCAANTYVGETCTDSCGNVYNGTKPKPVDCADVGNLGNPACPITLTCAQFGQTGTWPLCTNPSCTSSPNSCGMTNTGTLSWGVCSASTPSNSLCAPTYSEGYYQATYAPVYSQSYYQATYAPTYSESYYQSYYQSSYAPAYSESYYQSSYAPVCSSPTVTITASPSRVKSGQTSTLTIAATGVTGTCSVTGPGVSQTYTASSCSAGGTITTPAITARSTYTVTCDSGTATAKVIVNMPFGIFEF